MSASDQNVVVATPLGLYCRAGDFYIDPWKAVDTALITHAHSDHARAGSKRYFAIADNVALLEKRIGRSAGDPSAEMEHPDDPAAHSTAHPRDGSTSDVAPRAPTDSPAGPRFDLTGLRPGEKHVFNDVEVSFHPAGHILGSAQIRIDTGRSVWVVSGDYKRAADPTCAAFEPIRCDTFISEATFALPIYCWPPASTVAREIHDWWQSNRRQGIASVLFCYALGKAQRVLAELMANTDEPVYTHGAVQALVDIYRTQGIAMLPTLPVGTGKRGDFARSLIIAPPGAAGSAWMRRFQPCATGFCSGWMRVRGQRRRRGYDRGFVLSDHADWPALLNTVRDTQASRVLLTHGYSDTLVRLLRERGCDAAALQTAYGAEE